MEVLTAALSTGQLPYVDWKMVHWRYRLVIQNGVDKVEKYQKGGIFVEIVIPHEFDIGIGNFSNSVCKMPTSTRSLPL